MCIAPRLLVPPFWARRHRRGAWAIRAAFYEAKVDAEMLVLKNSLRALPFRATSAWPTAVLLFKFRNSEHPGVVSVF
jgi:hypothetical protein